MKRNVLVMISPVSAARIAGIARYAREHSWHLMIQDRLGYRPLAWNGDGVVATLRSDAPSVATILKIRKRGIPVVDVTMSRPDIRVPRVTSDHVGIGRLAAEHFAERNFRNVVWFSAGWGSVHELRYRGLAEKIPAARWIVEEALPKARRNDWSTFMSWMAKTLRDAPKPLAALTYDEADAARLLDAAERVGVSVPEELAILSIGNDPINGKASSAQHRQDRCGNSEMHGLLHAVTSVKHIPRHHRRDSTPLPDEHTAPLNRPGETPSFRQLAAAGY